MASWPPSLELTRLLDSPTVEVRGSSLAPLALSILFDTRLTQMPVGRKNVSSKRQGVWNANAHGGVRAAKPVQSSNCAFGVWGLRSRPDEGCHATRLGFSNAMSVLWSVWCEVGICKCKRRKDESSVKPLDERRLTMRIKICSLSTVICDRMWKVRGTDGNGPVCK